MIRVHVRYVDERRQRLSAEAWVRLDAAFRVVAATDFRLRLIDRSVSGPSRLEIRKLVVTERDAWGVLLGERRTRELIEVRHGLEVRVARLAAELATAAFVEADMVSARGRLLHFLGGAGPAASTAPDPPGHPSSARSLDS
jgi:hypothetical protein